MSLTRKILIVLILIHCITYWLYSDHALERSVGKKYLEFADRRMNNQFNKDLNESIYVASCGDEFFRDLDIFTAYARKSNPMHAEDLIHEQLRFDDVGFYQFIYDVNYRIDLLGLFRQNTDTINPYNTIVYEACQIDRVPFLYAQVQFSHSFSSYGTDFHIMTYNDMMHRSKPIYVWFIAGWLHLNGNILGPLDEGFND